MSVEYLQISMRFVRCRNFTVHKHHGMVRMDVRAHTVTRRHSAMLGTRHCHPATLCHAWYNTLSPGDTLPCLAQHAVTRRHSAMLSTAHCHPATLCHAWYNTLSPGDTLPCLAKHAVTRRHSAMLSTARCHPATLCHA